ncbi:dihydrofolate reductase family protein [Marinoscillum pacificum]|uniref:dihydrofolate reductase family protein n=1 Tax=Marinoscillum pacificum TaxID=392723 RepID=UPI00215753D0|nr:dihydrofolate reductase family protein [Marinoscillum pacificum]
MKRVKLFIATSLDGYIARSNGDVDWLYTDQDYGYTNFLETIDTVLMGGKTYRQVLGFGDWPYSTKKSYIFTHDLQSESTDEITFIHHDIPGCVRRLKKEKGKDIWLVGGAEINTILLEAGLIDELWIFKMPVLLGTGVPLFNSSKSETWLQIKDIEEFDSGLVKMIYHKKLT